MANNKNIEITKKDYLVLLAALDNMREESFGIKISREDREFLDKQTKEAFGERMSEEEFDDEVLSLIDKNIDYFLNKLRDL